MSEGYLSSSATASPSLDIMFVIGQLNVGGTERHLSMMARALKAKGWRIAVYSLAGGGPLRGELEAAGVSVIVPPISSAAVGNTLFLRGLRLVFASFHLIRTLRRMRPRIAHFFLPAAYLIGAFAASIARIEFRIMSRRSLNDYQRAYPAMRWIETRLHRRMNAVLGNSRAVVRQLRDEESVSEDRLCLIYNGIEVAQPQPGREATRRMLDIKDGTLVHAIVANLIPYKGHLDLIAALEIAAKKIGHKWRLLVVGRDDGAGADIRAAAQKLSIAEKISFLGSRTDVASLLSASDVGLLCSHQEGFSNAILESMAAGLPMIVTDVGGNAEAVLDGETGLVVPAHDPEALAVAISRLAHDPALRQRFGEAGRLRIQKLFQREACIEKYDALYRGVLAGKKPGNIPELHNGPV